MQLLKSWQYSFISFFSFSLFCLPGNDMEDAFEEVSGEGSLSESSYTFCASGWHYLFLKSHDLPKATTATGHPSLWLGMCSHGTATPFQHHATSEITNLSILGILILSHGNN